MGGGKNLFGRLGGEVHVHTDLVKTYVSIPVVQRCTSAKYATHLKTRATQDFQKLYGTNFTSEATDREF